MKKAYPSDGEEGVRSQGLILTLSGFLGPTENRVSLADIVVVYLGGQIASFDFTVVIEPTPSFSWGLGTSRTTQF